jgi:hypothetical protein
MFGYGTTKKEEDEGNNNSSTNNKTSGSDTSKCQSIACPLVEIKESTLRVEQLSLFDGKTLLEDKLIALFAEEVKEFKKKDFKDIYRPKEANSHGGIDFLNKEITSMIRSSGTEIIKQVGKKIISGDFNLTTISFPIKVMVPYTMLQMIARSLFQLPYYMHLAKGQDVVERLKLTITATISPFSSSSFFLKPMNPVLGETYEAIFSDGSKAYLEQTSHHPPVSSYEIYGPNNSYYFSGFSKFSSSAGLNSLGISNKGKKYIKFPDGVRFDFNFFNVSYISLYTVYIYCLNIGNFLQYFLGCYQARNYRRGTIQGTQI